MVHIFFWLYKQTNVDTKIFEIKCEISTFDSEQWYSAMIHNLKMGIKPLDHEMKCYDGQLILTLTRITIQKEDQNNTIVRFLTRQLLLLQACKSIQIHLLCQEA